MNRVNLRRLTTAALCAVAGHRGVGLGLRVRGCAARPRSRPTRRARDERGRRSGAPADRGRRGSPTWPTWTP